MEESLIYLQRSGTREDVEAELWDDISDLHLDLWRTTWKPRLDEARRRLLKAKIPLHQWPQDLHWDWGEKTEWSRPMLALKRFAITCGGALQGLMLVNLAKATARLPSQRGKDLAYIDFVSTAPWNRPEISGIQQFHGVGTILVLAAIELSRFEGFQGRIGLHSLSQATDFYANACGMSSLGPDPHYDDLDYFEMTQAQADAFRQNA